MPDKDDPDDISVITAAAKASWVLNKRPFFRRVPEGDDPHMQRLAACIEAIPAVMAERRTMPSRDFLVRQAILSAIAEEMPATVAFDGAARTLEAAIMQPVRMRQSHRPTVPAWLEQAVLHQFRALVKGFGGTTCLLP